VVRFSYVGYQALAWCVHRSGTEYSTAVQYLLLLIAFFEVLEVSIHGHNELKTSNYNYIFLQHHSLCLTGALHGLPSTYRIYIILTLKKNCKSISWAVL
jgi:hypothetical protein